MRSPRRASPTDGSLVCVVGDSQENPAIHPVSLHLTRTHTMLHAVYSIWKLEIPSAADCSTLRCYISLMGAETWKPWAVSQHVGRQIRRTLQAERWPF